ncbi:MAG: DNA helicase RecQ [Pseudomonadota bacterium]
MNNQHSLLSSVFGFETFRPGQAEIVEAVISGENTLAILPTGAGKSLCYQLPALARDGLTVVISPLIALMRDQVRALKAAGVSAGALTSGNTEEETDDVLAALHKKDLKILYIAPERLASGSARGLLKSAGTRLIAVDEAHCVSQWGHDFRPDYLRIGELRRSLDVPLAAFTATADAQTQAEIISRLFDDQPPRVFLHGFDRPNIHLSLQAKNSPRKQILDFATDRKGQSGIVYCGTRAKTETLANALREDGHAACHYHGGMDAEDRRQVEARFQREDGLIVVATVAFGMGIDKPDIRWVAHADLPKSIEAYYQEIGRAGRDGAPAETLSLYGADDVKFRRQQIDEGLAPNDRKAADHARLNALLGLAEAIECRRKVLLGYFGDTDIACGNCDLCDTPPQTFDGTEPVRKALSAILRTGEYFGSGHIIDILTGNETDKVRQRGHHNLPTFGLGRDLDRRSWQSIFRQMMAHDLIRPDPGRHGAFRMTQIARPLLSGETTITLRKDTMKAGHRRPAVKALVSDENAPLLSALKAKRRALAEAARVPAYVIFNDRTLIEMAETRPRDLDAFARISGVGAKKLENYGEGFLSVINGETPEPQHPLRRKLAGKAAGHIYDRLLKAQAQLSRGSCGQLKPLSCSASQLAKVSELYPGDDARITQLLGEKRAERFGAAFIDILQDR